MSDRKYGNNKDACKLYAAGCHLERNKKRNVARAKRQEAKAEQRIIHRIGAHKPVPSKHLARRFGTSDGSWELLDNGERRRIRTRTQPEFA